MLFSKAKSDKILRHVHVSELNDLDYSGSQPVVREICSRGEPKEGCSHSTRLLKQLLDSKCFYAH